MNQDKHKRVFWLGMHVVLVKTELPRLRALGYEVFNPPYLTNIYDQSAVVDWDREQASTLPPDVFEKLSRYNFFYNKITPEIAELLDEYFGTVIVTISPIWLQSVLDAYHGRVIYRVYGQPGTLTETLWFMKLFRAVQERENFYFVPHAAEAIVDDHSWLKARMAVVPYTLPLDVFEHENTWSPDERHAPEIMVCCPNIDNPMFAQHYQHLNVHFPEPHFKLYGVQPRVMPDPRVAGTLPRQEQLRRYPRAAGYFYHYQTPTSCYLPPVEMMTIGGPVVYMSESLLARSFSGQTPGEAKSIGEAKRKIQWLLDGDRQYIDEVRQAQQQIVRLYHPEQVHPIFDRVFRQLLDRKDVPRQEPAVLSANAKPDARGRTYVLFHASGHHIEFQNGAYQPLDELARSVKRVVQELLAQTENEVVVTCFAYQFQHAYGYLDGTQFLGRLRFMVLDPAQLGTGSAGTKWEPKQRVPATQSIRTEQRLPPITPAPVAAVIVPAATAQQPVASPKSRKRALREILSRHFWPKLVATLEFVGKSRVLLTMLVIMVGITLGLLRVARTIRALLARYKAAIRTRLSQTWRAIRSQEMWIVRRNCITRLNADKQSRLVIVPHRSLFPDALFLERPMVLCADEDPAAPKVGLRHKLNGFIARCLTEKAIAVISSADLTSLQRTRVQLVDGSQTLSADPAAHGVPAPKNGLRQPAEDESRSEGDRVVSQTAAGD